MLRRPSKLVPCRQWLKRRIPRLALANVVTETGVAIRLQHWPQMAKCLRPASGVKLRGRASATAAKCHSRMTLCLRPRLCLSVWMCRQRGQRQPVFQQRGQRPGRASLRWMVSQMMMVRLLRPSLKLLQFQPGPRCCTGPHRLIHNTRSLSSHLHCPSQRARRRYLKGSKSARPFSAIC